MKNRCVRLVVAVLCCMLMLSGLSGGTVAQAAEAKYDISIFTDRNQPNPDSDVMKKIEELLGVNLEVISAPDGEYENMLNLFFSAGDLPDVFTSHSKPNLMLGAAAPLTPEEFEEFMPLSYKAAQEQLPMLGLTLEQMYSRYTTPEGKLSGVYIGQVTQALPYGIRIRQDLVDSLNGGKMPETLADWDEFLANYKQTYPDKYPITCRKDAINQDFYMIFAAFGTSLHRYCLLPDDTIMLGSMMPEMREAVLFLKDWYDKGYINPEFMTMDYEAYKNEWKNGNTVYMQFSHLNSYVNPPFPEGSDEEILLKNVPGAKLAWAPFPSAKEDVKPSVNVGTGMGTECTTFGIHLAKDKDKLHAAMGVIDKLCNDKEIYMLRNYGIEGVTYEYVDGIPQYKADYAQTDAQVKAGINWLFRGSVGRNYELEKLSLPQHFLKNVQEMVEDPDGLYGANRINGEHSYWVGDLLNPDGERYEALGAVYEDQFFYSLHVQIVIGEKPIEAYDELIAEWKSAIGDEWMAAATAAYQAQKDVGTK